MNSRRTIVDNFSSKNPLMYPFRYILGKLNKALRRKKFFHIGDVYCVMTYDIIFLPDENSFKAISHDTGNYKTIKKTIFNFQVFVIPVHRGVEYISCTIARGYSE